MPTVRPLLAGKNGKLGSAIFHFDLPVNPTCCPGASDVCRRACYATHGRFATRRVKDRLAWCYEQSLRDDFAQRMTEEMRAKGALVVRIHVSGDLYDGAYADKWLAVIRACPQVRFYLYTRCWRVPEIVPALEAMAGEKNTRVWYSCDSETGEPEVIPKGVRLAFLQHDEVIPTRAKLVFRTRKMRPKPRVGLPMVCPQETDKEVNCGNCQHCFR